MLHVMIGVLSSQLMQSEIIIYSLVRKCEALKFLLDNIYNRFGSKLYLLLFYPSTWYICDCSLFLVAHRN